MHIFPSLNNETLLLTPNKRLCTHLLADYNSWQYAQGKSVWPSPQILPLSTWLNNLWQSLPNNSSLLSEEQALWLWQNVVENSSSKEKILDSASTAKLSCQAWRFLREWQQPLKAIKEFANPEVNAFIEWATQYQQSCHEKNVIDQFDMINQLSVAKNLTLPKTIYLVGFDEIVPQTQNFLTSLPCELIYVEPEQSAEQCLLGLTNTETEIETMLRWAKYTHEQTPDAKIICVVPELEQWRPEIVRKMHEIFFPQALIDSEFTQDLVNISGGYSLNQAHIIKAALLLLLRLNSQKIDYQSLTALLTSIYIQGAETQLMQRALLDAYLRNLDEPELSWRTVLNQITEYQLTHPLLDSSSLITMFENFLIHYQAAPHKASHAQWQSYFLELLNNFGWPGPRNLSSIEYQQIEHFYDTLNQFVQLDKLNSSVTRVQAMQELQLLISANLFQPQTETGPIQILGLLEAAGLESDYMWVMGLDTLTWPAAANPNPFIPQHLQRQWRMPHSSAMRELNFSLTLQKRFIQSYRKIIFSYPEQNGDQELQCSTLLQNIPEITSAQLLLPDYIALPKKIQQLNTLTQFNDNFGPELQKDNYIRGGSSIFKDQAACPFQAFARHRLSATSLNTPELNFSYIDKGNLLHATLDNVWQLIGTQEKLLRLSDDELTIKIKHAINKAFETEIHYYAEKFKAQFKKLEQTRLQVLVMNWLNVEKQRPPFVILEREQAHTANFGHLNLRLRIDRIDKIADDKLLVMDYKSGAVKTSDWEDERLREPQLPLYCIINNNISAISFAEIKADNAAFKGFSSFDSGIPGIKVQQEWQELVAQWSNSLNNLADEFNSGLASVTPQDYACDYCELANLCRINEVTTC